MRVGDFSVEVVPHGSGRVRETSSGHVLARPGQVYRLRLRNHGPLRAVVHVTLDGRSITESGLVLDPMRTTELERPIRDGEHGRFVVVAEGSESVFGPDGGRDNPDLGLVEADFKRELPRTPRLLVEENPPFRDFRPLHGRQVRADLANHFPEMLLRHTASPLISIDSPPAPETIERAAGTGLTGHSDQEFQPVHLGPLEDEATVIRLRIVVGTDEAIEREDASPRASAPARPLARP